MGGRPEGSKDSFPRNSYRAMKVRRAHVARGRRGPSPLLAQQHHLVHRAVRPALDGLDGFPTLCTAGG